MTDAESVRKTFELPARIGYSDLQTAGAFPGTTKEYADAVYDNGFEIVGTTDAGVGGAYDMSKNKSKIMPFIEKANTLGDNNGYITECGSGNINLAEVIKVAEQTDVMHLCVEQDIWPLGFASVDYCMRKGYEHLSQFLDLK